MKILIADRSKTMRRILRRTLRQAGMGGHEIHDVGDGAALLRELMHRTPGLVLSDRHLPKVDGLACLKALRESGVRTNFGFVTTAATALFREEARDAGAAFVIGKPFTTEMFEHILSPLLLNGEADVPTDLAPATLQATLRTLCGKPCMVQPVTYWDGKDAAVVASYSSEAGTVGGALFAEAGFACAVAAATNLAPPALARHALRKNIVPAQLQDCVRELANIMGGLLNHERRGHVQLDEVWLGGELPEVVGSVMTGHCRTTTYDVLVPGYCGGRITLANDLDA
ncbi:MAG: response regulator [Myxococcota bacterium]